MPSINSLARKFLAISSMLQRYDNVLNFKLAERVASDEPSDAGVQKQSVEIPGKGGSRFAGDWYPPPDLGEGRFPAVVFLHGLERPAGSGTPSSRRDWWAAGSGCSTSI